MPVSAALGAMALGGGLQGLWQYNRENYFFDVPLRQSRQFQMQNIGMVRYALFREDLRDLSALTTQKVQNYFVVNTLKLGFIVSIFFNFDRTDEEGPSMDFAELQINLIFSMTLMTAFFNLLTSIWFSTHAVMLADSFTTKLLVQACRVPLPTLGEVTGAATDAKHFESNLAGAFRVPLLNRGRKVAGAFRQPPSHSGVETQHQPQDAMSCDADPAAEDRPNVGPFDQEALRGGTTVGQGRGPLGLEILDIIDGTIPEELVAGVESSLEPHLKLFKLIRPAWAGFDLYGKVAMEIGTATLLSGLAFYAIYYLREKGQPESKSATPDGQDQCGDGFRVLAGGWISYACLSALAWYSLALDLQISFFSHVLLVMPMIGSFIGTVLFANFSLAGQMHQRVAGSGMPCAASGGQLGSWHHVLPPVVMIMQAIWVQVISWSGAGFGGKWPTFWRATRYLNVLHLEEGPSAFQRDLPTLHGGSIARFRHLAEMDRKRAAPQWRSPSTTPFAPTPLSALPRPDSLDDQSTETMSEDGESEYMSVDVQQAIAAAFPLLSCFGAVIDTMPLGRGKLYKAVYQERDRLYEASRAAGALPRGAGALVTTGLVRSFWLEMPPTHKRAEPKAHWLDLGGDMMELEPEGMESEDAPHVRLDELFRAARRISDVLFEDSATWTPLDMERLARYGGEPIPGVASFLAQFHHKGSRNSHFPGTVATFQFRIGVLLTSILWAFSCLWSVYLSVRQYSQDIQYYTPVAGNRTADLPQAFGKRLPLVLPRPWLLPTAMGCDGDPERMVLADIDAAYVGNPNGSAWRGPIQPCWDADLLSVDFGTRDNLWFATSKGIHEVALDGATISRLCTPQPPDMTLGIESLAIDSAPPPGSKMPAIALANHKLHVLEADPTGGWRLAAWIGKHIKKPIIGLALYAGHAVVLDSLGVVFRLDSLKGRWEEPLVLGKNDKWKGICAVRGMDWLAIGRPVQTRGERQLWRFSPPGPGEAGQLAAQQGQGTVLP